MGLFKKLLALLKKLLAPFAAMLTPGKLIKRVFGSRNERVIKGLLPVVAQINAWEPKLEELTDEQLMAKTPEFSGRLKNGETLDDILPEAYAVAREASKRTLGLRPFDVQLMGSIALHRGSIAEMVTGEGKTLTSVAPAYLNALTGRGVHIITVNDYLARRDAAWNGPVYEALGLTVGCVQAHMHSDERIPQYRADITYGTNSEFGFDYLRDNMKSRLEDQCQYDRHFAIIDEVDSILIDEARTPLIISGPADEATDKYYKANRVVRRWKQGKKGIERGDLDDKVLSEVGRGTNPQERELARMRLENDHYFVYAEKSQSAYLTESGIVAAQSELGVADFYAPEAMNENWPHHLEQAVRAHMIYQIEDHYVVRDGEVVIVDEFTGRMMEGRRWSDGLHQSVEAKEGIKIREEFQTLATVTIQNFFRLYDKLAGMTGTALTEASEFHQIYKLDVVVIPTNMPLRREEFDDRVYLTEKEKYKAVVDHIVEVNEEGRPILVGTTSIEKSEMLSGRLMKRGVKHEVLNAKHHEKEAMIIAKAGQNGAVTIATNMAGRGTNILLGNGVPTIGGLHIVGTERHESRRIDNQLRGRSGRQGDPGSSAFYVSLEDPLMRRFAREKVKWLLSKLGMGGGQEITSPLVSRSIARAQKKTEEHNFDVRKHLLEYDKVNDDQRNTIYRSRTQFLRSERLEETTWELIEMLLQEQIGLHMDRRKAPDDWSTEEVSGWARRKFGVEVDSEALRSSGGPDGAATIVRDVIEAAITETRETIDDETWTRTLRFLLLRAFDEKWKDHIRELDALKQGIGLRGYAQQDPKQEYRREASVMFGEMERAIAESVTDSLLKMHVTEEMDDLLSGRWRPTQTTHDEIEAFENTADTAPIGSTPEPIQPIRRDTPKIGRNDPCPCGSGKKYKKCHGRTDNA